MVGFATAMLIYSLKGLAPLRYSWFSLGKYLAAFSFSLYAVHYPLNYLVESFLLPNRVASAGPLNWLAWVLLVLAMAAFCYLFYWLFERRSPDLRKGLERVFGVV